MRCCDCNCNVLSIQVGSKTATSSSSSCMSPVEALARVLHQLQTVYASASASASGSAHPTRSPRVVVRDSDVALVLTALRSTCAPVAIVIDVAITSRADAEVVATIALRCLDRIVELDDTNAACIAALGGVDVVLTVVRAHCSSIAVVAIGCSVLSRLACSSVNASGSASMCAAMVSMGGIDVVAAALRTVTGIT